MQSTLPADPFTAIPVVRMEPEFGSRRAWIPGARRVPGEARPLPKPFCFRCRREVASFDVTLTTITSGRVRLVAKCHDQEEIHFLDLGGLTALLLHPAFAPAPPQTLGPRLSPSDPLSLMNELLKKSR